ncbi:arylsulfatase [Acetobacter malorum]|uniref:arylsulfatase n=1 Tax=Acetobacter malorum TaxID=178901 RepID=UPI0039E7D4EB
MRRFVTYAVSLFAASSLSAAAFAQPAPQAPAPRVVPPAYPQAPRAPQGAPNILLVLLDDAGFATSSAFGGKARTPNLERFAAEGVRYNQFNTTSICSPTRAALLTGRNHHQVGFGNLMDIPAGFDGYNTVWKPQTASVARILQLNGYSTAAFGKWHNTPRWETSAAGPFNHWPTGLGFDHFYGFLSGTDDQWEPHLYNDTTQIPNPATPEQGYHLTKDLVGKAVSWVDDHEVLAGNRPYFLYFATGAVHMPHNAAPEWIAKNKGRFDEGWDHYREEAFARQKQLGVIPADAKLTPRPAGLPAWSSLSAEQKHLYAHQMEVFSAYMEETDQQVGKLVDTLRARPGGDNLLVFYIVGDNGGSGEGGLEGTIVNEGASGVGAPDSFALQVANYNKLGGPDVANNYAAGWAWATSTPFQWMKQVASHFGGTRNPLIVDWPGHTQASDKVRTQFSHVNDIAPTILDILGVSLPEQIDGAQQIPFEGHSLLPTFTNPAAPEAHTKQYFEIFANRAIYKDGWVAAARHDYEPWNLLHEVQKLYTSSTQNDRWELYHIATDYSEADDLAAKEPQKLEELKKEFTAEAQRNGVFPLLPPPVGAPTIVAPDKHDFTYPSDISGLPPNAIPVLAGRAHRVETEVDTASDNGRGVIVAQGGRLGGYVLYEKDGHLVFENSIFGQTHEVIAASERLPAHVVKVGYAFTPDAGHAPHGGLWQPPTDGTVQLLVNGKVVTQGKIHKYPAVAGSYSETFDIGQDRGSQVSHDLAGKSPYGGKLGVTHLTVQ